MILFLMFISVFAAIGLQFSMSPDMILVWYKGLLIKLSKWEIKEFEIGKYIAEPLGLCVICNSHWVAFIILIFNYSLFKGFDCPVLVFEASAIAVSGISTLVWFVYNFMRKRI